MMLRFGLIVIGFAVWFSNGSVGTRNELSEDSVSLYPSSCLGLDDGYYYLKPIDGSTDDYPVIYAKCSNEYMLIDYSIDSDISNYFSSWDAWYRHYYGPISSEKINWQEWYLPSKYGSINNNNDYTFIVSPDCDVCDNTQNMNSYYDSSGYYLSGTIHGTLWTVKGTPNYEQDWATEKCWIYNGFSVLTFKLGRYTDGLREEVDDYTFNEKMAQGFTGTCAHIILSSNTDVSSTPNDQPATGSSNDTYITTQTTNNNKVSGTTSGRPSIGTNGKYCVCAKSQKQEWFEATNEKETRMTQDELEKQDSNKGNNKDRVIKLYQSDFEKGTFRIIKSGTYILMEDILFDFGANLDSPIDKNSYWPNKNEYLDIYGNDLYPGAGEYKGPYSTGWFAGITIEVNDVIIDLNGYTMGQSDMFYYLQRWFTCIELGSQYFIPGQGPFNSGATPQFAHNIIIKNGKLGPTSHHGIHGNHNKNIIIENIHIFGFETHGIQLSGFDNVKIIDCEIGPTSTRAYFTNRFGHGKNLAPRYYNLAEYADDTQIHFYGRDSGITMNGILTEMEKQLDYALKYVIIADKWRYNEDAYDSEYDLSDLVLSKISESLSLSKMDESLFAYAMSEMGIDETDEDELKSFLYGIETFIGPFSSRDDGFGSSNGASQYGIFLNTYGSSLFVYNLDIGVYSNNAYLENIKIHGMTHKMHHQSMIFDQGAIVNAFNMLFDAESVFANYNKWEDKNVGLTYKGNIMTDAALMAEYIVDNTDWSDLSIMAVQTTSYIYDFALGNKFTRDDLAIEIACNSDGMLHTGKGTQGLRIDGVENVYIKNIYIYDNHDYSEIENIENDCSPNNFGDDYTMCLLSNNNTVCDDESDFETVKIVRKPHFLNNEPMQHGFTGNTIQGITINSGKDITFENVYISDLTSKTGAVYGISIWPNDEITLKGNINIQNLHAGYDIELGTFNYGDYPNQAAEVCGIRDYSSYYDTLYNTQYYSMVNSSQVTNINSIINPMCLYGHIGCLGNNGTDITNQVLEESDCNIMYTVSDEYEFILYSSSESSDNINELINNNINRYNNNSNYNINIILLISLTLISVCFVFTIKKYLYPGNRQYFSTFKYQELP